MERNRTNLLMGVLIVLVVVLAIAVLYAFLIKPQIQGYAIAQQNLGVSNTVATILQTVGYPNCGSVPFTIGNQTDNQTVTLVSLTCVQAAYKQAQAAGQLNQTSTAQ